MAHPTAKMRARQYERVAFWLGKDKSLTNVQLKELTGAADSLISKVRKELGVPATHGVPTHTTVDVAFKKFMEARGVGVQRINPEFNPWVPPPNKKEKGE